MLFTVIVILYGITSSITTFDIRLIQARKNGILPPNESMLPEWVAYVYWIQWIFLGSMIYLNWKAALVVWIAKFILKVLPVLETIGNIIMSPFKPKNKSTKY